MDVWMHIALEQLKLFNRIYQLNFVRYQHIDVISFIVFDTIR